MAAFKDDIRVTDRISFKRGGGPRRRGGAPPITPMKQGSNVHITLREEPDGTIVEERWGHNIFLDYGREWIAELCGLNDAVGAGSPYRNDRVAYMAFGIGGTSQIVPADMLRGVTPGSPYSYAGYPDKWGYSNPADLTTGSFGSYPLGGGAGDPAQTDDNPAVTGLEYPVQVETTDYYDSLSAAVFPEAGTVRFRAIVGYSQISFGAFTSIPISEVGLFTESVPFQDVPPLAEDREVPTSGTPKPPLGVRYMIAYNTFDTLSKTPAFVLQVDWELRFA